MIPDEDGFINKPLIFTFLPDQQDEKGKTMKLIDLNSRVHDACTNVIRRMETADLARSAALTSAASLAYRMLFNGLMSEHGYGPDDPLEWATRSTRTVITIRELATEYRMLAETSEDYDTRGVLQDVAIALNTLANEIQYPHVEPEPEPELEPKLEPGVLKCASHSTLIDWSSDIKEAYQAAVKSLNEAVAIVKEKRNEQYVAAFFQLLRKACASQDFINTATTEKKLQLTEAAVIVEGVAWQFQGIWYEIYGPEKDDIVQYARDELRELARVIRNSMPSGDTEQ